MLKLTLLSLSLAACATTATGIERDTSQRAKVKLDLSVTGVDTTTFPQAIEPTVPSVDRISHAVRAHLGESATAELSLCVSPSGAVKQVELTRSSSYVPFDKALLVDAATWQFASLPGPDSVMSCRKATIAYRVY